MDGDPKNAGAMMAADGELVAVNESTANELASEIMQIREKDSRIGNRVTRPKARRAKSKRQAAKPAVGRRGRRSQSGSRRIR